MGRYSMSLAGTRCPNCHNENKLVSNKLPWPHIYCWECDSKFKFGPTEVLDDYMVRMTVYFVSQDGLEHFSIAWRLDEEWSSQFEWLNYR